MQLAQPTLAVFTKNRLNPAYHAARLGADRTAARLGAKTMHFVPQRPDDIQQQIALIDQALARRPAAFIFVPVHGTAIDGAIRRVARAGVPVFNFINRLRDRDDCVTFVGADDYRLAKVIGERLLQALPERADVAVLEGTPGSVTSRDRVRGFLDAARAYPRIRIAASRAGDFLQAAGRSAMQQMLREAPQIAGVFAANDSMALGAIDALAEARNASLVVGVNAIPDAIAALKSGRLLATADFDAMKMACIATEAAVRFLRGERVPGEIILPVRIVDAANCSAWDMPLEERACPSWDDVVASA